MNRADLELPSAVHIEKAILGAMLSERLAIFDATSILDAEDFSLDSHKRVYRCLLAMIASGKQVDYLGVQDELSARKELDSIGGPAYLAFLTEGIPRNLNIENYVRIVKDAALARRLMTLASNAGEDAADRSNDPKAVAANYAKAYGDLATDGESDLEAVGAYLAGKGSAAAILERMATPNGIKIGMKGFDEVTGGIQHGELCLVAAMSSMGKSAFACNLAFNVAAIQGKVVAFFPLEDKRDAAIRRMLAAFAGVPYRHIRDASLRENERLYVMEELGKLSGADLFMDDSPASLTAIQRRCARLKRKMQAQGRDLDMIVIDQLSHVPNDDVYRKGMAEHEWLGAQGHRAKLMAEELDTAVVLLHQLTQESGKRTDPTPKLTDLAGSGRLKNHASIVALLHRPGYYDAQYEGSDQIIIAKNRDGETKTCPANYTGATLRWTDAS